jgi:NTP pyrophosphatase (non-canonical NTP hydrolase)
MMRRIYFQRDSKRGIKGTFDWLVEEVEELGNNLKGNNRRALEDEFADVLAWLTSLANIVDIDLDNAATLKYDNKCPKCRKTLCKCPFSK